MRAFAVSLVLLAAGCAGSGAGRTIPHEDAELASYEGERARLQTDLPREQAQEWLAKLETMELILDAAFPFLPADPESLPLTVVVVDPARFALHAQDHDLEGAAGAFVCREGEVYLRYRPEDWDLQGPPFPLEPRVRPLAAAALRRRVLFAFGKELDPTWLEEGLALVFVELAAHEFDEKTQAVRLNRERLLDAFLPTYLGAPPRLRELVEARGRAEMKRKGSPALAWAAARFLLTKPEHVKVLELALRDAAGAGSSDPAHEAAWEEALAYLDAHEREFETFLRDALHVELLAAFVESPTPVDRWESAAALRLVANLDLDAEAGDRERLELVRLTEEQGLLDAAPIRFLDQFEADLAIVRGARSRLQAMSRVMKLVRREFERRTMGYGHPAVEDARKKLSKNLQWALEHGATKQVTRRVVLALEDGGGRTAAMQRAIAELQDYELVVFQTAAPCVAWLAGHVAEVALLSLDFHLGPAHRVGNGMDVAQVVAAGPPSFPVILHTSDGVGAMAMREVLDGAGWATTRLIFREAEWRDAARRLLGVDG